MDITGLEYDAYIQKYYIRDTHAQIGRRIEIAQCLIAAGETKNLAWHKAFKHVPRNYVDPSTGKPVEAPSNASIDKPTTS